MALTTLHAEPGGDAPVISSSSPDTSETGIRRLPRWLKLSAEARGRLEYGSGTFTSGAREFVYLDRIRVETNISARSWMQIHVQAQDARAPFLLTSPDHDGASNPIELRQGFLELGRAGGLSFRAGRQTLSFGDESLLGSDDEWCNLGKAFDAAVFSYRHGALSATTFSGRVVEHGEHYWDRSTGDKQISGLFARWNDEGHGLDLQPFAFWKNTRAELDRSVYTFGLYGSARLGSTEFTGQGAFQRGTFASSPIDAHAFSLGVSRSWGAPLTVQGGFKQASGATAQGDSVHRTFDDLYPSGYNAAGILDPFAWRNLRDVSAGITWHATRSIDVTVDHHVYWLASVADGLYCDDGLPLSTNPHAASSRAGAQTNLAFTIPVRKGLRLQFGGAHFEAGPWMHEAGFHRPQNTAYLSVIKSF